MNQDFYHASETYPSSSDPVSFMRATSHTPKRNHSQTNIHIRFQFHTKNYRNLCVKLIVYYFMAAIKLQCQKYKILIQRWVFHFAMVQNTTLCWTDRLQELHIFVEVSTPCAQPKNICFNYVVSELDYFILAKHKNKCLLL